MKTINDYKKDIKKYIKNEGSKTEGLLRTFILKPTPTKIRRECLRLLESQKNNIDQVILKNFFEYEDDCNKRRFIGKYEADKLKPICYFISGKTSDMQSDEAIELVALLIDFQPRPYSKYRSIKDDIEYVKDKEKISTSLKENQTIKESKISGLENTTENFHSEQKPAWKINIRITVFILIFFIISGGIIIFSLNKPKWMVWQEDHYVEVSFDTEKYKISQLKLYNEDRILYFKKVAPDCDTEFFKPNALENLWYGKSAKGEIEYFTALGKHPETGRTLKPITEYMIKKYICKTYK